jgi:ribosomal protein S18 acetylase RimI-like enzyme
MDAVVIRRAAIDDIELLLPLFESYRQFYRQPADAAAARRFLLDRFRFNQSVVFLAMAGAGVAAGFTQLYPSFSSTGLSQIWTLNDLYVAPEHRRCGVATRLLDTAAEFARSCGATRLTLSTEITNREAQALYEARGWTRSMRFHVYNRQLD